MAHQIIKELTGCSPRPPLFIIVNRTFRWNEILIKEFLSQRIEVLNSSTDKQQVLSKWNNIVGLGFRIFASYMVCDPGLSKISNPIASAQKDLKLTWTVWPCQKYWKCFFLRVGHRGAQAFLTCWIMQYGYLSSPGTASIQSMVPLGLPQPLQPLSSIFRTFTWHFETERTNGQEWKRINEWMNVAFLSCLP